MIKRIGLLMVAALMAVMMMTATAVPAFADPLPEGCFKDRGTVVCPSVAKNDKFTGNQVTTKKGSLQSSHEEETACVETPCPPGQFR